MITMSTVTPYRILFVCLGNICRSPAAEVICRALAAQQGLADVLQVDSCGTASYHTGSRPDSRMIAALERAGYAYDGHRARTFRREDFSRFDLIIPQDEYNERDIRSMTGEKGALARVRGMWCWFGQEESEHSVPDPYYGGPADFDAVVALLTRSVQRLLDELRLRLQR